MSTDEKWIVLLAPDRGGTATPVGLFPGRDEAIDYMAALPTVVGLRAVVLRLEPPGAPVA